MKTAFQTHVDARGDLWVADGVVIEKSTGAVHFVGDGENDGGGAIGEVARNFNETAEVPAVTDLVLVGGSGSNVILTGPPGIAGIWRRQRPGVWVLGALRLTVTGESAATIADDDDTIAVLSTGGEAPAGDYEATTHGEERGL